jgi:hypothetical protein
MSSASPESIFRLRHRKHFKNKGEAASMPNVYFGNMPDAIFNTAVFFKNDYEDEWIIYMMSR